MLLVLFELIVDSLNVLIKVVLVLAHFTVSYLLTIFCRCPKQLLRTKIVLLVLVL